MLTQIERLQYLQAQEKAREMQILMQQVSNLLRRLPPPSIYNDTPIVHSKLLAFTLTNTQVAVDTLEGYLNRLEPLYTATEEAP